MRLLTSQDLVARFSMTDVVNMVEAAYQEEGLRQVTSSPRNQLRSARTHTFFNILPALMPGLDVVGVNTYTGGNKGKNLPQKVMLLFSTEDGRLLAVLEADWISWMRTGATSGVATRYLAREEAAVAGIIGAGKQARSQLMAVAAVRDLKYAVVFSRTRERSQQFSADLSRQLNLEVRVGEAVESVLAECDIICTATTAREPLFDGMHVRAGTHVNAIGQHYPNRREVDSALVSRSKVIVDDRDRALQEDGELLVPIQEGLFAEHDIHASLGEIVAGTNSGRDNREEITLFSSGGIASEVIAVAAGVYRFAEEENIGIQVDWSLDSKYWQNL